MKKLVGEGKPFHSAVDKTAALLKRKSGTGAEFMKELMGVSGVKPTELQERGLTDIMGMPKMTHDQFMAELGKKPAPAIREKVFANKLLRNPGSEPDPHHEEWTLPGGDNYREMLIKAPKGVDNEEKIMELDAKLRHIPMFNSTPQQQADIAKYYNQIRDLKAQQAASPQPFPGVSNHFGGEPNILASMRLKDRTGPNGEKLLHLEELQSDWHQQGRDKGYQKPATKNLSGKVAENKSHFGFDPDYQVQWEDGTFSGGYGSPEEAQKRLEQGKTDAVTSGVPDAPFKKNWEEMALKRLIHHAAEKGYHGVVVTPGHEQAKRYSIGNHIGQLNADEYNIAGDRQWRINAKDKSGNKVPISNQYLTDEELASHVGKELANKIIADRGGEYSGLDLHVGGEGMKGFYDKKVPNILNTIGKKYGVKTELHAHPIKKELDWRQELQNAHEQNSEKKLQPTEVNAHHFPITEEMRKDVLTNGLPLYAQGGTVHMADGGDMDTMKLEMMRRHMAGGGSAKPVDTGKRVTIHAEGSGGVKGIVVPRHTLEGNPKAGAIGLHEMNEARAKVYGEEHREPLTLSKMASMHKKTLADHFAKPLEEQHETEEAALNRLREAKHIGRTANTLDESEKLDTVRHEEDAQGRTHVGYASKGVAGHALYTSGHGNDTKYNVVNTCPGQTEGCGGGKDAQGIVDTKKGTCFAPNAESQYAAAAVRRAAHAQAKHDPAMTNDWILAHTGSLRNAARLADKGNKRLLFRPNVVDETDVTSRHVIRHLNDQRKAEGKPPIIANSYGKTNELHDPENGYYVTHSNVGPKVKKGESIAENIGRDKARVRNTIMAADNKGDFRNEQGNKTPPKGSYMVTDVKRGSPMAKKMEAHITHAKYWTTGREEHELTPEEKAEGPEGHFGGNGKPTSPDKAHFGHITVANKRFDYQKQHILHPRLVQVGENKDGTPHMIPTDSRFKDEEFLPKNRFKTKNGKEAGHILMTTPTESTSNIGHQTSFTHNVSDKHIDHAIANKGEYEIDKPQDQLKAAGKEYSPPQLIKFYAEGGGVGGDRHIGFSDDNFHAFPEQNVVAQRHLAMRDEQASSKPTAKKVKFGDDFEQFKTKHLMRKADGGQVDFQSIGVNEAPNMDVKAYFPPRPAQGSMLPVGGIQQAPMQPQQPPAPQPQPSGQPPMQPNPPMPGQQLRQPPSNILQMTPQGQAMSAIKPPQMAHGGHIDRDMMMFELMNRQLNRKQANG
jgi:hypothetical protein